MQHEYGRETWILVHAPASALMWRLVLGLLLLTDCRAMAGELFSSKKVITANAPGAACVFATDINGDGYCDVVSASYGDSTVAWYENDGANPPGFIRHVISNTALGTLYVHAADIDGDGDLDVVAYNNDSYSSIVWYENKGGRNPSFVPRTVAYDAHGAIGVIALDVNGDGHTDIVGAASITSGIAWYENDGATPPLLHRASCFQHL